MASSPKKQISSAAAFERPTAKGRPKKHPDFHNPYNFIPSQPRDHVQGELGDGLTQGHGRYQPERWSGRIAVKLSVQTPLLIPDASQATQDDQHQTFPMRIVQGQPYLAPASIKGMLRSSYEAITNSRMGIFHRHADRLAYREPARDANTVYPARVELGSSNQKVLRIMPGHGLLGRVARLPRYDKRSQDLDKGERRKAKSFHRSHELPQQGQAVWVKLQQGTVAEIHPYQADDRSKGKPYEKGWVYITGPTTGQKQYERVFIERSTDPAPIPIGKKSEALWRELIQDYQAQHEAAIARRREKKHRPADYLGQNPGETAYARHIYTPNAQELTPGTLLYVRLDDEIEDIEDLTEAHIVSLLPVPISRRLFDQAPESLLHESLKPAQNLEQLSPADRVFGWVNSQGAGAYKGQLRIDAIQCVHDDAVQYFDSPIPLAILGQPKPQQSRFYLSQDAQGTPIRDGVSKASAYQNAEGLRGRKVYPHHTDFQESNYRRLGDKRDSQNRSITGWVKPNTQFTFTIDLINLSSIELGALLYLLELPPHHYHRLGFGKPLGFGSIRLEIDWEKTTVCLGSDWQTYYSSLLENQPTRSELPQPTVAQFKAAIEMAYGGGKRFLDIPFIQAFHVAAKGFADHLPIRYPHVKGNPEENYKWFTSNEKGDKLSLPPLWNELGLPLLDEKK